MKLFLEIENDYRKDLSFIPYEVRMKLDLLKVKLSLKNWLELPFPERRKFLEYPLKKPFKYPLAEKEAASLLNRLEKIILKYCSSPLSQVLKKLTLTYEEESIFKEDFPKLLKEKIIKKGFFLEKETWGKFSLLERYALNKLILKNKKENWDKVEIILKNTSSS